MICVNASGDFKSPALIIRSGWPRDVPKYDKNNPWIENYDLRSNESGWVAEQDFKSYFFDTFVPYATNYLSSLDLPVCGILICDNCKSHTSELQTEDGAFTCVFLPPRTTSLIQPCDQNIFASIKKKYNQRMKTIGRTRAIRNKKTQLSEMKSLSTHERFTLLGDCWGQVTEREVVSSWKNLFGETFLDDWKITQRSLIHQISS